MQIKGRWRLEEAQGWRMKTMVEVDQKQVPKVGGACLSCQELLP